MAQSGDMKAHDNTYGGFIRMLKVGTVITVIITALVVLLISG